MHHMRCHNNKTIFALDTLSFMRFIKFTPDTRMNQDTSSNSASTRKTKNTNVMNAKCDDNRADLLLHNDTQSPLGKHFIFCYGTLKRNEPNHRFLLQPELGTAEFVGTGRTSQRFPLIVSERFSLPFLLDQEGMGKQIEGEVYRVDNPFLTWLDDLEDLDVYSRKCVAVQLDKPAMDQACDGHSILSLNPSEHLRFRTRSHGCQRHYDYRAGASPQVSPDSLSELQCVVYVLRSFPPKLLQCKEMLTTYWHDKHAPNYTLETDDVTGENVYEGLSREADQLCAEQGL